MSVHYVITYADKSLLVLLRHFWNNTEYLRKSTSSFYSLCKVKFLSQKYEQIIYDFELHTK